MTAPAHGLGPGLGPLLLLLLSVSARETTRYWGFTSSTLARNLPPVNVNTPPDTLPPPPVVVAVAGVDFERLLFLPTATVLTSLAAAAAAALVAVSTRLSLIDTSTTLF